MVWMHSGLNRKRFVAGVLIILMGLVPACSWFEEGPAPAEVKKPSAAGHWQAAMSYKDAGNYAMSAVELEKAIRIDPNMYQAYYHLGVVYEQMGQNMQAMRVWRAGLEKARTGPDRLDYPRQKAMTEMQAARAALQEKMIAQARPKLMPPPETQAAMKPEPKPKPAPPKAKKRLPPSDKKKAALPKGKYGVLYASYLKPETARNMANKLQKRKIPADVMQAKVKGRQYYRVVLGCCTTRNHAKKVLAQAKKMGLKEKMLVMKFR